MQGKKTTHAKYTVAVRIRPPLSNASQSVFSVHGTQNVKELKPKSIVTYSFDEAFDTDCTNLQIYETSVAAKVNHFIEKKVNTTILAYGQTGSGKTHTLFGHEQKNPDRERGLCEYILSDVVKALLEKGQEMSCSFMQIYKQKIMDLISGAQILLRENAEGELSTVNLTTVKVQSFDQILKTVYKANSNKIFGSSNIHSESSRSHVMLTLERKSGATLNIVDLCGCEVLTYKFDEKQREETNAINLSLFTLNAVINDLCSQGKDKNKFIPFRNSVLTRLLKKSLINQKKTQIYLFCNIAPEEKHQQYSSSTLRFGQVAISVDEAQNVMEEKVNLSQQKRDMKKVQNIVDLNPKPNSNRKYLDFNWEVQKTKIWDEKVIIYTKKYPAQCKTNILFLHAYGYSCCGRDFDNFIPHIIEGTPANLFSVDFPGFGSSDGKKFTSRSQDFGNKGEPLEFMVELFKIFKFSPKNKVFLVGYDLGGAISLSSAMHQSLKKSISGVSAFHPTWTDKIEKLAMVSLPVQLIWFPIETFHLVSAGQKMSKAIKESRLFKLNVGPRTEEKAAGYYDMYNNTIGGLISDFINVLQPPQIEVEGRRRGRGKIMEEVLDLDANKQEQQLETQINAVKTFQALVRGKKYQEAFDALIKGGEDKPKYVRLASQIPAIDPHSIKTSELVKFGFWKQGLLGQLNDSLPLFPPGRQVHIRAPINLCVLQGPEKYLSYDKTGQKGITHRAYIAEGQSEQKISEQGAIQIKVWGTDSQWHQIKVDLYKINELNSETLFKWVNGAMILEDAVSCKYNSLTTKLMLARCCFALDQYVKDLDLAQNTEETLKLQKLCSKAIFEQMDLRHLVHEGIDNTRFTGTDVGKLAYYGQGNCHHLASVLAALLLPFSKILGWDVIFRAGSFFCTGRDIDKEGNPLPGWNGKPNTNVEDHTWLQIVYKPSFKTFVMDPSFGICSEPIDRVYTFQGKMHISGKNQCGSKAAMIPDVIYGDGSVTALK